VEDVADVVEDVADKVQIGKRIWSNAGHYLITYLLLDFLDNDSAFYMDISYFPILYFTTARTTLQTLETPRGARCTPLILELGDGDRVHKKIIIGVKKIFSINK